MSLNPRGGPAGPLAALAVTAAFIAGCGAPADRQAPASSAPATAPATGKDLVDRHCVRCHLAPEPADLAKEYWPYALHYMGNYVGMKGDEFPDFRIEDFPPELEPVKDYTKRYFLYGSDGYFRDFYPFRRHIPAAPEMSREDFLKIREYYVANARPWKAMEQQAPKAPLAKLFRPVVPKLDLEPDALVLSTLVDPARGRLYVGRTVIDDWVGGGERRAGFDKWDDVAVLDLATGRRLATQQVTSDPIDMALTRHRGAPGDPRPLPPEQGRHRRDHRLGVRGRQAQPARMLVNGKQRFVQHHTADMNGDGLRGHRGQRLRRRGGRGRPGHPVDLVPDAGLREAVAGGRRRRFRRGPCPGSGRR